MNKHMILFVLCVISVITSCTSQSRKKETRVPLPIELFVDNFVRDNPNYKLNDITKEEANTIFKKTILDTLKSVNMLKDVPLKLKGVNKADDKVIVHLQSWILPNKWEFKGLLNKLHVDVFAEVSDSLVGSLENNKYYYIHGRLLERLNGITPTEALFGRSVSLYTNSISFEKDEIYDDKIEVNLGILHFQIDSISAFK